MFRKLDLYLSSNKQDMKKNRYSVGVLARTALTEAKKFSALYLGKQDCLISATPEDGNRINFRSVVVFLLNCYKHEQSPDK